MEHFTVEETNLICIYISASRTEVIEDMAAALPLMDVEMRMPANSTLEKLRAMTDAEFATHDFYFDFADYDDEE